MKANFPYTEGGFLQVVEYKLFYPEDMTPPTIKSLLENIPREEIVSFAQAIVNTLTYASIEDIIKFLLVEDVNLHTELQERFKRMSKSSVNYIFTTPQTPIELLRQAFSIKYVPSPLTLSEKDERLLKAILLINEKLHVHNSIIKHNNKIIEACQAVLSNSFSQKGFDSEDYYKTFRITFTRCIDFFEYAKSNSYFKPIYNHFITELVIKDYSEYITTILGLFAIMKQNAEQSLKGKEFERWMGDFTYIKDKLLDDSISINVLDLLSIDINDHIPLNKNEDYVAFRAKPLIKKSNDTYAVYNLIFLFERLFNSLYFDFMHIAEKKLKLKNFGQEYKEKFFEETLLHKYISKVNSNGRYFALSGKQAKQIKQESEPDYYLRNKGNNNVILFEHKDIKIRGDIKQSRYLNKIIAEYKNKTLLTTESSGKKTKRPSPVGVGQLINLMDKIRKQTFIWDKDNKVDATIYPVLVLTDANIIPDGLTYLMNTWLYENLKTKGISSDKIRPLIVMEVSTLLLYSDEFKEQGLEFYFEEYYKMIFDSERNVLNNLFLSLSNLSVSFSDYMLKVYEKDFVKLFDEYFKKIKK